IGDGPNAAVAEHLPPGLPVLRARLEPRGAGRGATDLAGKRVYAFAGIGRPEKFFDSLRRIGAELAGCEAFADHQPYDGATIERLAVAAAAADAQLVTTAKDAARLGPAAPPGLAVLDVALVWDDKDGLLHLLERLPLPSPRASTP
ncbi:MAG TPA: tetraacyldisaccharide 4'-kinase, partial [Kiloniellaceae bacterium]